MIVWFWRMDIITAADIDTNMGYTPEDQISWLKLALRNRRAYCFLRRNNSWKLLAESCKHVLNQTGAVKAGR